MATPSRSVVDGWCEGAGVTVTPIRLACCITELEVGGAERMFVELMCRLDRSRFDPTVISLGCGSDPLVERLQSAGIEVRCLGARRRWEVSVVGRLVAELKRVSPDLLQTWLFHANVAGGLASRRAGVGRLVTGIRVAERRGRWRLWLERICTRRACRHVCVSREVAEFSAARGVLNRSKLEVIPNGVDVASFADVQPMDLTGHGVPVGARVVAWIGRLDHQKDPLAAVEAFGRLSSKFDDCHLVLAGEGRMRVEIEARVLGLCLSNRVHLLGRVTEIGALLSRSCGLLLTSRWEGMPNVVLEAMAASRPVVSRLVEGVSDLVVEGVTGWLVRDDTIVSLSVALEELLGDVVGGEAKGASGQERVGRKFSIEAMVARYEALWEREVGAARVE